MSTPRPNGTALEQGHPSGSTRADAVPEDVLADLSRLAGAAFGRPRVMVSLLDPAGGLVRSWLDGVTHLQPLPGSLLERVLRAPGSPLDVPDLLADPAPDAAAFARGPPPARSLAAVALTSAAGHPFGALAVLGDSPGALAPAQAEALLAMGRQLAAQLALRQHAREMERVRESEEQLRALVENADAYIFILDAEARIQFINRIPTGRRAEDFLGRNFAPFVAPADWERIRRVYASVFETGRTESYEIKVPTQDLGERWFASRVAPLWRDGKVAAITIIGTDITDRKVAEDGLQSTLSLLQATLDSTADGTLVVDTAGRILTSNRKFREMWRVPPHLHESDLDGALLAYVLDQIADPASFLARVKELYASPEAESFDVIRFKDGRVYERYSQPQRLEGAVVGRVWSFRDVTERVRAEEAQQESAARFQMIARATNDVVWDLDLRTETLWWNETFSTAFGYAPEEIQPGLDWWSSLLHPEDAERVDGSLRAAIDSSSTVSWSDEYRFRKRDGTYAIIYDRGLVLRDATGKAVRMVGSMMDVTERKRAEERLIELKNHTQEIVDNVPAGVIYLDPSGRVTFENRYLARIFNVPDGGASPFLLRGILNDPALASDPRFLERVRGVLAGEPFRDHELVYARPGGGTLTLSVSGVPIVDTASLRAWVRGVPETGADAADIRAHLKGGILLVRDITKQKKAEEELEETRRSMAMAEKLSALGTLVAGVAHEINNPLAFMKGTAQLTEEGISAALAEAKDLPAEAREALEDARRNTEVMLRGIDRIAHITHSLKQVARASSGVLLPEDLNALAEGVLTVAAPRLEGGIRVHCDLRATRPALLCAPEISQVLLNLVLNAAEAMAPRGGGTLTLRTFESAGCAVVEVGDTGPGIRPEDRHRIFTPFYTTKPTGTGLGLSVSYRIVEDHGGRLVFSSAPGRGTVFRVELPLAPPADAPP